MEEQLQTNKGVVYVTSGSTYTRMAIASAETVKRHNPKIAIHLFTDQENISSPFINSVELITAPHRRSKVDYLHHSPFEQTLYLDADTFVLASLEEMFDVLTRFDIAMTHCHKRNIENTTQNWNVKIPYAFPQLNSGVVLYRKNDIVTKLFSEWQAAYHSSGFKKDQVTLRELVWLSNARLHILPPEYNIRFRKYLEIWTEEEVDAKILHDEEFTIFFKQSLRHDVTKDV